MMSKIGSDFNDVAKGPESGVYKLSKGEFTRHFNRTCIVMIMS